MPFSNKTRKFEDGSCSAIAQMPSSPILLSMYQKYDAHNVQVVQLKSSVCREEDGRLLAIQLHPSAWIILSDSSNYNLVSEIQIVQPKLILVRLDGRCSTRVWDPTSRTILSRTG